MSVKKKRKRSKKRRIHHNIKKGRATLLERVKSSELFSKLMVLHDPPEKEKMSEVILKFLDPLLDLDVDDELMQNFIAFGTLAWNASLFPKKRQKKILRTIMDLFKFPTKEDREVVETIFKMLLARKKKYFSENKRVIVDYQLSKTRKGLMLDVASTQYSESPVKGKMNFS